MTRDDSTGEAIEHVSITGGGLGVRPAMPPRSRSHDERRIGDAAGDDDIGTGREGGRHGLTAEIGVRGEEGDAVGGLARIEVGPWLVDLAHARCQVIA